MNIQQLTELCSQWQEKLGLSHWRVGVRICRLEELKIKDVQATSEISLTTECALISILDSRDYPDSPFQQNMEVSLVHELLHIPMKYIAEPETGTLEHIHTEAFIERLARLLVEQKETKTRK